MIYTYTFAHQVTKLKNCHSLFAMHHCKMWFALDLVMSSGSMAVRVWITFDVCVAEFKKQKQKQHSTKQGNGKPNMSIFKKSTFFTFNQIRDESIRNKIQLIDSAFHLRKIYQCIAAVLYAIGF